MNLSELLKIATKAIFAKIKWSQEQLINGTLIEYDGEEIDKSSIIYQVSPDGAKSLLPDGQYKTKSGCLFVLTDGKVSSVEDNNTAYTQPVNNEPVKQAQSAATPEELNTQNTEMNIPIKKPATKVAAPVTPVKADEVEQMATDTAAPADAPESDDSAEDATSVQEIVEQALAPITAALQQILATLGSTTTMASETKAELSKVKETVTKLADEPAPEKKEIKTITNPFNKSFPDDLSETATYKVMKAGAVKK